MAAVIDMRDFGSVNDPSFDNTDALVAALTARGNGEPSEIFFASGDWYFSGPLPVGTSPLSIWDNASISGEFSAATMQHQEEPSTGSPSADERKDRTVLVIDLENESDIWWNHVRDEYRFGPVAFRDVTFQISNLGSLFAFGDPSDDTIRPTMRGLHFERCYLTRLQHYILDWLEDAGGSPGRGWVLSDPTNDCFGLRMHQVYDGNIGVSVRGFKYGVIEHHCDCLRGEIRGGLCGKFLDSYSITGASGSHVGAHWVRLFGEAPVLCGFLINGQVGLLRCEPSTSVFPGFDPGDPGDLDPDLFTLPAEIEWSITAGSDTVDFTFPMSWGKDCRDYFVPRLFYRFLPTTADEPPYDLYVTDVAATELTFANHESTSYIRLTLDGDGSGVWRPFGAGAGFVGDRAGVAVQSIGMNYLRSPRSFWVPDRRAQYAGPNLETAGPDTYGNRNTPVIVANCAGHLYQMQGGVGWAGSGDRPSHPLASVVGHGPVLDENVREAVWDENSRTQLYLPGRGVSRDGDNARLLTFHYYGDPEAYAGVSQTGTIDNTILSPTATEFEANMSYAGGVDYYNGRSLVFTSGAVIGLVANIVDYRVEGSGRGRLLVSGLLTAPANGVMFDVIGEPIPCYRPSDDSTNGWTLPRVRRSGTTAAYTARVYAPATPATMAVYGGAGSSNSHALVAGWNTIYGTLVGGSQLAARTIKITASAGEIYVASVKLDQNYSYSGTYVPTLTDVGNTFTRQNYECQYMRVGNSVSVSGKLAVSVNATSTLTQLAISLPVATDFGGVEDCAGTAVGVTNFSGTYVSEVGEIRADPANRALLTFFATTATSSRTMYFHFMYQVIP